MGIFDIDWRDEIPSVDTAVAGMASFAVWKYLDYDEYFDTVRLGFFAAHAFPLVLAGLAALVVLATRDTSRVTLPAAHKQKKTITTARAHDLNVLLWHALTCAGFGGAAWWVHASVADASLVPLVWQACKAVLGARFNPVLEVHLLRRRPDEPELGLGTLLIGDHIFVNKLSYRTELPYDLLGVSLPLGGTTLLEHFLF